jgi:hypothetical protein
MTFEIEFEFTSSAYYPKIDEAQAQPTPKTDELAPYLSERLPHIVFNDPIKHTVDQLVGTETNPLKKARAIFYFIDKEIRYHGEEEYSIIPASRPRPSRAARATAACRRRCS